MKIIHLDQHFLISQIKRNKMFQYLEISDIERLLDLCDVVSYQPKEKIIKQGDLHPYFYAILTGTVEIRYEQKGEDVFITAIKEGDIFGESGIFADVPRTANVVARNVVFLLQLERKNFMRFIKRNPEAGNKVLMYLIYSLIHKLKEANQELAFDRKMTLNQNEIDDFIETFLN